MDPQQVREFFQIDCFYRIDFHGFLSSRKADCSSPQAFFAVARWRRGVASWTLIGQEKWYRV
jgi:hypothetical protein